VKISSTEIDDNNFGEYFSEIWELEIYEDLFHKILIKENVIDSNHESIEGFKNVSANFFHIDSKFKEQIMKKRVTEPKFAKYLNQKYNAQITIKKGFKIGNSNHIKEDFSDIVEDFLNEEKKKSNKVEHRPN
jgi:hypothetical protein